MAKSLFKSLLLPLLTGLLALLPLLLTLALLAWLGNLLNSIAGPSSQLGHLLAMLGQPFSSRDSLAYLLGTLVLLSAIYALGLAVQLGLRRPLGLLFDLTLRRAPLLGRLYNLADRFVGLLDRKDSADLAAMSPVWCFFGGDGSAVLGLMPNPQPVELDGRPYCAVLVPTAPIPVGGGLIYVPAEWVRPANIGMDTFTSIYVSMGITPPPSLARRQAPNNDGAGSTGPAHQPEPDQQAQQRGSQHRQQGGESEHQA